MRKLTDNYLREKIKECHLRSFKNVLVRVENQMYNALNGYNFKETEERGGNHKDPPPK